MIENIKGELYSFLKNKKIEQAKKLFQDTIRKNSSKNTDDFEKVEWKTGYINYISELITDNILDTKRYSCFICRTYRKIAGLIKKEDIYDKQAEELLVQIDKNLSILASMPEERIVEIPQNVVRTETVTTVPTGMMEVLQKAMGYFTLYEENKDKEQGKNYLISVFEVISDIPASLKEMGYEFVHYKDEPDFFQALETPYVDKAMEQYPAIRNRKDHAIVVSGWVYIPKDSN